MPVYSFINQKGGVGKTTLSINFAGRLARDSKVLFIDADPQGTALKWNGERESPAPFNVMGYPDKGLHKEVLKLKDQYDHIVIDGPPRVTALARAVIIASDFVVIPVRPSAADIWASQEIFDLFVELEPIAGEIPSCFVINFVKHGTVLGNRVEDALAHFSIPIAKTRIYDRVTYAECMGLGSLVVEQKNDEKALQEIESLFNELII